MKTVEEFDINDEVGYILGSYEECADEEVRKILVKHGYPQDGLYFVEVASEELKNDIRKLVEGQENEK